MFERTSSKDILGVGGAVEGKGSEEENGWKEIAEGAGEQTGRWGSGDGTSLSVVSLRWLARRGAAEQLNKLALAVRWGVGELGGGG